MLHLSPQRGTKRHLRTALRFRRAPCRASNRPRTGAHCIQGFRRTPQAQVLLTLRGPPFLASSPSSQLEGQREGAMTVGSVASRRCRRNGSPAVSPRPLLWESGHRVGAWEVRLAG
jgi:hypothetical protein